MAAAAIAASFLVPLPYYVDSPGSVRATQPLATVSGHRSYTSKGVIMYTTVSERRGTPIWMLRAWLDDTIDTRPVDDSPQQRTAENHYEQELMDQSKLKALTVAFRKLDIPLEVTGSGALIKSLMKGFPAEKVLHEGDIITAIDAQPVKTIDALSGLLAGRAIGDEVRVSVRERDGESSEAVVALGRNEEDTSRGFLGVQVLTADQDVDLPFEINLDSGAVIGPSAGLAWTLGVLDRLTPGDLTHGRRVAVTGTIESDGSVGAVGGIAQKVAGAMDQGATLFLYPKATVPADVKRMKSVAGDQITLKAVGTVDDALAVLDPSGLGASPA